MKCFEILQIQPTNHIEDIEKAYNRLLKTKYNDEDPKQFQEFHKAYLEALEYAKAYQPKRDYGLFQEQSNQYPYDERQQLIDMFISQARKQELLTRGIFSSTLFLKYYQDRRFIDMYMKLIQGGLYTQINHFERKKLKKIHQKLYFKHSKNEYIDLYHVLYPYLYNRKGGGLEITLLAFCLLITCFMYASASYFPVVFIFEFILISFYTVFVRNYVYQQKYKKARWLQGIIWFIFIGLFMYGYQTDFDSIKQHRGEFTMNVQEKTNEHKLLQLQGDYGIVKNNDKTSEIITSHQQYLMPYRVEEMRDFALFHNQVYYIYDDEVYIANQQKSLTKLHPNSLSVRFIYNDEYCLIIEVLEDKVQLYQIKDQQVQLIDSLNQEWQFISSFMHLYHSQLYYTVDYSDYLWVYDIELCKNEETNIPNDNLRLVSGNDYLFLNYRDEGLFMNRQYELTTRYEIEHFLDLGDGDFAYVDANHFLYVIENEKEKVVVDLGEEIDVDEIAGSKDYIILMTPEKIIDIQIK